MKIPSDKLFRLIQSMTKAEKRAFKLQVTKYKNSNSSIIIFDLLNQQKTYDEIAILKKLKSNLLKKNFKVHKKYLYDAILKSLRSSKVNTDIEMQLREEFDYCVILRDKGFIDETIKDLDKLIAKAKKNDSYSIWAEAASWKAALIINKLDKDAKSKTIEALDEQRLAAEALRIEADLNEFFTIATMLIRNQEKDNAFKNSSLRFLEYPEPFLPLLKYKLYTVKIQYYFIQKKIEESYKISKQVMELVSTVPAFQETNKIAYCSAMATHLRILEETHRHKEMIGVIKIWSDFLKQGDLGVLKTRSIFVLKRVVRFLELSGALPKDFVLGHHIEDISQYLNTELQSEVYTEWYDQLKYHFVKENYKELLSIHDLKNSFPLDAQVLNYTATARLLLIIAYFELGEIDILMHLIDTTKYFLKQNNYYEVEMKLLLNFFRNKELYELKVPESIFLKLQEELEDIGYSGILILSWLNHRLANQPVLVCYRSLIAKNKNKELN